MLSEAEAIFMKYFKKTDMHDLIYQSSVNILKKQGSCSVERMSAEEIVMSHQRDLLSLEEDLFSLQKIKFTPRIKNLYLHLLLD